MVMTSYGVMSTWSANFSNSLRHLRPIPLRRVWDGKVQDLGEICSATHPDIPTIFSQYKMHQNDSKCKHIHQITAFPWHVLPHFSESGDLQSAPPVFEWAMMRLFQRDLVGWVSNRLHASGTQLQRFDSGLSPLHHLWWLHSSMGWPECEDDSQLEHP